MSETDSKSLLRKKVLKIRNNLTEEFIESASSIIGEKMFSLPGFKQAGTVMFFLSFDSEINTYPMVKMALRNNKRVAAPKTYKKDRKMLTFAVNDLAANLIPGVWGISEPDPELCPEVDPSQIDFVVVPGVAFDRQGNRLGYGGGYYDRFLPLLRPDVTLAALAFSVQIVDRIPTDPWDRKVDVIITEKEIMNIS